MERWHSTLVYRRVYRYALLVMTIFIPSLTCLRIAGGTEYLPGPVDVDDDELSIELSPCESRYRSTVLLIYHSTVPYYRSNKYIHLLSTCVSTRRSGKCADVCGGGEGTNLSQEHGGAWKRGCPRGLGGSSWGFILHHPNLHLVNTALKC